MIKQAMIREYMAKCIYKHRVNKGAVKLRWELLTIGEKKPYLDVTELQLKYLQMQGVMMTKPQPHPLELRVVEPWERLN